MPSPPAGRKLFVLDMFPYPSGTGLHVGHPLGFTGTDVYSRYQRMAGRNVLYTMGFDAFGLPAEQFAVQTGQHPAITTAENVATYREQIRRLGLSHDRRRSIDTTDPAVLPLDAVDLPADLRVVVRPRRHQPGRRHRLRPPDRRAARRVRRRHPRARRRPSSGRGCQPSEQADVIDSYRLAYVSDAPVNWCPGLGTVVANEEVTADGRSDRGNFPVFKRSMRQWMMRITEYADRLLDDLDVLEWTDSLKTIQRNWIGRSTGANVDFDSPAGPIRVFTTRPDTLFGATFMVLAPEHPMVADLTTSEEAPAVARLPPAGRDRARTSTARTRTA